MFHVIWNTTLKFFYIISSAWIIFVMMRVYARTREKEKAYRIGGFSLAGSLLLAPFVMLIFDRKVDWSFAEVQYFIALL